MNAAAHNPTPESEHRKRFALCWTQAQPIIAAYIASGVRDRQHCEDVIQETAMAIAEAFDHYDRDKPFLPWAMGVARHKLLQYYRRHSKDRLVFDEALLSQIGAHFERQGDAVKQRQTALASCLEKLAEDAREMIRLRYVRNLGYDQIAEIVGRTRAGVSNNLFRSRKALAKCIQLEIRRLEGGVS